MRRKSLSYLIHRVHFFIAAAMLGLEGVHLKGEELILTNSASKFLGAVSCGSSGCHGGGGQNQNQYLVWSLKDFHSQRPFATLTTARSKQIADALQIKDPPADNRCTVCHAPLSEVPTTLRAEAFKVSEGVSCESCHGPAENWLRAHTRSDYSRADRVSWGMRDLKSLYVRANTCVACHQNVDSDLLAAGHPELIFELDGQSVSQPKHWRENTNWNGAQAWLIGQAVALREMSWQFAREKSPTENQINRWAGLAWVLQTANPNGNLKSALPTASDEVIKAAGRIQSESNELARDLAAASWTDEMTRKALFALTGSSESFRDRSVPQSLQARRAERLILALDRLFLSYKTIHPSSSVDAKISHLFKLAQSLPEFSASEFADTLNQVSQSLEEPK